MGRPVSELTTPRDESDDEPAMEAGSVAGADEPTTMEAGADEPTMEALVVIEDTLVVIAD